MKKLTLIFMVLVGGCLTAAARQHSENVKLYTAGNALSYMSWPLMLKRPPGKQLNRYHFQFFSGLKDSVQPVLQPRKIPQDFYYAHCYGFFCKIEWVTQQKWHIPLTFRLGSIHYVDKLEGKE